MTFPHGKQLLLLSTFLAWFGYATSAPAIPTNGLVAGYLMDGNTDDSSGHGFHGTLSGATLTTNRFGQASSAYVFSNELQAIFLPLGLLTNSQGSIAFWFRNDAIITGTTGSGSYHPFQAVKNEPETFIHIGLGDFTYVLEGEILGTVVASTPSPRSAVPATTLGPIPPGWHHVALTSSSSGHILYFDGIEYVPTLFNGGLTAADNLWPLAADEIRLGGTGSSDLTNKPYALDNVLIYDRPLTLSEIRSLALPLLVTIRVSQVEICWNSQLNLDYQVQYRSELNTNWVDLGSIVLATNFTTCVFDSIAPGQPQRFYRVVQLP